MMRRPWHIWIAFGLCLAVLLAAMAWVSLTALTLDRAEAEARRQAALEESVRLALWRMDSALATLVAQESARPYFSYSPFYPAGRAYTRMFAKIRTGEVLIPSPLLVHPSPYILLHFQCEPTGETTSPQAPDGNMRDLAEMGYTTHEKVLEALDRLEELRALLSRGALLDALPGELPQPLAPPIQATAGARQTQVFLSFQEQQARVKSQRMALSNIIAQPLPPSTEVREGALKPVWTAGALLLARRVAVGGEQYVQGCWLDWPAIRRWLLGEVRDLLPEADLEPVTSQPPEGPTRMLAALPARLVPGPVPAPPGRGVSPIRLSLMIAWACVLLAATAVAVLLHGALALSERRGAFVSAVTHELRTPLTTFRMYAEMLAENMVPDPEKQRRYIETLRTEADRLSHLVQNVLAYARLERGRTAAPSETVDLSELLDRIGGRLSERAERSGMHLVLHAEQAEPPLRARADPSAVEQILFNLVDNSCKYGAHAADRRVHLETCRLRSGVAIRVRDHGPGIAPREAARVFRPFRKSARDAANSAPGVGLGLALSRRLARQMGGDLQLDKGAGDGACFVLTLPPA